jgi:hypothetical protein
LSVFIEGKCLRKWFNKKMAVFGPVALCCLVVVYEYLRGACSLCHQGEYLWHVSKFLLDYTLPQHRMQLFAYSPSWESQILYDIIN